jgi:hypothetical protein
MELEWQEGTRFQSNVEQSRLGVRFYNNALGTITLLPMRQSFTEGFSRTPCIYCNLDPE